MSKDFDSLFGWQNNSVFKLAESLRSLTMAGAFATSMEKYTGSLRLFGMTKDALGLSNNITAVVNQPFGSTVASLINSPAMRMAKELADSPAMRIAKELADSPVMRMAKELADSPAIKAAKMFQSSAIGDSVRGLATSSIFGGSVAHLTAFDAYTATAELTASTTIASQYESVLERMGGWNRIAGSVARHFSPEHDDIDGWEEDEPELEEAVAYVKDELAAGKSLESIASQASVDTPVPQNEYTKGVLIGLIVFLLSMFILFLWESVQKINASRPAIHYAEQHGSRLAVVVNKTGVNVRETSDDDSFSVHSFDEGVYVLLMPGRTKNRREIAYEYDDGNNPVKTGWVPPGALRIVKDEEWKHLLNELQITK